MPRFALTFDDGPGPWTERVLSGLAAVEVKATFFILGANVADAPWCAGDTRCAEGIVRRVLREGHVLGNHSWSHATSAEAARDIPAFSREVLRCERLIRTLAREVRGARKQVRIPFRLPFGPQPIEIFDRDGARVALAPDPRLEAIAALGRPHVHWTGVFWDWEPITDGAEGLAQRFIEHCLSQAAAGQPAVLLLHDGFPPREAGASVHDRDAVVEAVKTFLHYARQRRWHHFTVGDEG